MIWDCLAYCMSETKPVTKPSFSKLEIWNEAWNSVEGVLNTWAKDKSCFWRNAMWTCSPFQTNQTSHMFPCLCLPSRCSLWIYAQTSSSSRYVWSDFNVAVIWVCMMRDREGCGITPRPVRSVWFQDCIMLRWVGFSEGVCNVRSAGFASLGSWDWKPLKLICRK